MSEDRDGDVGEAERVPRPRARRGRVKRRTVHRPLEAGEADRLVAEFLAAGGTVSRIERVDPDD